MAHTIQEKKKLLNRVCKIMGQIAEAKEVATLPPPQASDITRYRFRSEAAVLEANFSE